MRQEFRPPVRATELDTDEQEEYPQGSTPPRRQRWSEQSGSERKPGGQPGHPGQALVQVAAPDVEVRHRPAACLACQYPLEGVAGQVIERRHVHDLSPLTLVVTDHQVEAVCCPQCQQVTRSAFPPQISAPAQYGPGLRALAVYLNQYQLLPEARTCETLADLLGCALSDGSVAGWVQEAASILAPTVDRIADLVAASRVQHADETGVRVGGTLHGLHVNSTRWLTHCAWHPKRGSRRWKPLASGRAFAGGRSMTAGPAMNTTPVCTVCAKRRGSRDLTFLAEEARQAWAAELKTLLTELHGAVGEWQQRGTRRVPSPEREDWLAQYFYLLAQGYAAQPRRHQPSQPSDEGGRSKARRRTCWMCCCIRPSRCWRWSKTA